MWNAENKTVLNSASLGELGTKEFALEQTAVLLHVIASLDPEKVDEKYIYSKMKKFEYHLLKNENAGVLAFYFSLKSIVFWIKVH